jgi:hypothetical protein
MVAATVMMAAAIESLSTGGGHHSTLYSVIEVAVALVLLGVLLRHTFSKKKHHEGIAWPEFASAAFIAFEAYSKTHNGHRHHTSFVILSYLPAFMLLGLGLFQSSIARRIFVRVDDDGIEARLPLKRFRIRWTELAGYELTDKALLLVTTSGTEKKIRFRRLEHGDEVRAWIMARIAAHEESTS